MCRYSNSKAELRLRSITSTTAYLSAIDTHIQSAPILLPSHIFVTMPPTEHLLGVWISKSAPIDEENLLEDYKKVSDSQVNKQLPSFMRSDY